jgi:hypothetical protein
MVCEDMGEHQLSEIWEAKYQRWLRKAKPLADSDHETVREMSFSWFA